LFPRQQVPGLEGCFDEFHQCTSFDMDLNYTPSSLKRFCFKNDPLFFIIHHPFIKMKPILGRHQAGFPLSGVLQH
jgi:hypothetical protein